MTTTSGGARQAEQHEGDQREAEIARRLDGLVQTGS